MRVNQLRARGTTSRAGRRWAVTPPPRSPFSLLQPGFEALPAVGHAPISPEEAEAAAEAAEEEAARRAAWQELNRLRERHGQDDALFRAAHERFVATWGHRGTRLRE